MRTTLRTLSSLLILACLSTTAFAETPAPASKPAAAAVQLDINSATADQIDKAMSGVGKSKAEAIVKDRETRGKFGSVDDLARVKGIGKATVDKNRAKITAK